MRKHLKLGYVPFRILSPIMADRFYYSNVHGQLFVNIFNIELQIINGGKQMEGL